MIGTGELVLSLRITTVVVPVALYFLILGLLNSRRRPQLLRARRDFLLLVAALGPVFVMPALHWAQGSWAALAGAGGLLVAGLAAMAPPRASWVIYNISLPEASRAAAKALRAAGLGFVEAEGTFRLTHETGQVRLSAFPLLHNVSVRMAGAPVAAARRFETALAEQVDDVPAETTPMAMALLLVATAMLIAPLALAAPRAGQIVRILTGMLY